MFSVKKWQDGQEWRNWSENERSLPNGYFLPKTIEDLQKIVKRAITFKQTIRVTGAGHSFSPVAKPEQIAVSLHEMRGLLSIDKEKGLATFHAGTYLYEIGPILEAYGFAVLNMGDIQVQSLAGVVSTGTHGTGLELGSFSSMVERWGFINGTGEYVEHERGDDDLSHALHLSLGLLGILVTLTIRIIPIYNLHYTATKENLFDQLPTFQEEIQQNRHLEWYYFPGSETIQVKKMNMAPYLPKSNATRKVNEFKISALENGVFSILSEATKWRPSLAKKVAYVSSKGISTENRSDVNFAIFPTPRKVKFLETEHAIRIERFEEAMEEIHWTFVRNELPIHFPIECRVTAGEPGFLSPTQGHASAFIAFHMYKGMNEKFYFNWVYDVMQKYDSRPHWGKINWYHKDNIYEIYPNAGIFNEIRKEHDPHQIFLTEYFKQIFLK